MIIININIVDLPFSRPQLAADWAEVHFFLLAVFFFCPRYFFFANYKEYDAANERHCARDRRQRYVMCLFASSVYRSDVNHLFGGCVRKTSPSKTEKTKRNQDHTKRLVHGGLLRRR